MEISSIKHSGDQWLSPDALFYRTLSHFNDLQHLLGKQVWGHNTTAVDKTQFVDKQLFNTLQYNYSFTS